MGVVTYSIVIYKEQSDWYKNDCEFMARVTNYDSVKYTSSDGNASQRSARKQVIYYDTLCQHPFY